MIRVFTDGFVPKMDLIELQGNIQLADEPALESQDATATSPPPSSSSAHTQGSGHEGEETDGAAEAVLGYIEKDHLNPKQRILRIGTLQVTGSWHAPRHPTLVLRARQPCVTDDTDTQTAAHPQHDETDSSSAEAVLFETWLDAHPDATSMDSLYSKHTTSRKCPRDERGTAPPPGSGHNDEADTTVKDYELVGWIEDKVVFNSKPARVFA